MSYWTYIRGSIQVSVPGRTQAECRYILDTVLDHLPLVTGSEGDMCVHVIQRNGYNCSSSHDEFGMRTNNLKDDYGDHSRRRGSLHKQDTYILVVDANLRDRMFEETKREFMKWIIRLSKRLWVEEILVVVEDRYEKRMLIDECSKFLELNEPPSWSIRNGTTGEPSWWEYLMWERDPRSDMPLRHICKYFNNDEVAKEMDRRRKWEEEMENAD